MVYGFRSAFDLLKPENYHAYNFKINLGYLLRHTIYLCLDWIFLFFRKEVAETWGLSAQPLFFQAGHSIFYIINNKGTSGLQNSSDTLLWLFIKNTYWKQSVFVRKGKMGNMLFHSYCCSVCIFCRSFSLANLWHCIPGRATTSQMDQERKHSLVLLDLRNFLFTLFSTRHDYLNWVGSFHLFSQCILVFWFCLLAR